MISWFQKEDYDIVIYTENIVMDPCMADFVLWCVKCDVGGGMGRVWIRLSTVGNLNLTHLLVGLKMSIQPNPTRKSKAAN